MAGPWRTILELICEARSDADASLSFWKTCEEPDGRGDGLPTFARPPTTQEASAGHGNVNDGPLVVYVRAASGLPAGTVRDNPMDLPEIGARGATGEEIMPMDCFPESMHQWPIDFSSRYSKAFCPRPC